MLAERMCTGATNTEPCDEELRPIEHDCQRKHATLLDYRSAIDAHLLVEPDVLSALLKSTT